MCGDSRCLGRDWWGERLNESRLKVQAQANRGNVDPDGHEFDGVKEPSVDYAVAIDYEHEHRDAEHEHEHESGPDPSRAPEDGLRGF
ncbi:hypothetical protein FF011L_19970 [Roseimaritima multifibrata]|uniref:Uncharacterized protein n=1 Tax=Roseimaritima multifibrata TaxID=1930274 RepID=A0A517MEH2_9BACT|nr:hypothetical protein [Roseimaritima multifibrata]QDS93236.1 hypothetical protein FF011L_19970 [Roseimaritima multifibrata]